MKRLLTYTLLSSLVAANAAADIPAESIDEIIIYGHESNRIGEASSASDGLIGQGEIAQRPILRSGEILEFVPGMVVTQHSGSGKANQYFLRGFNLDHGTDFSTSVDGMPINMRSHGHGQGYTDLSFIVPELVEQISYQKGPYHAEDGDFSTAGSANFRMARKLNKSFATLEIGEDAFLRGVAGTNIAAAGGDLVLGLEAQRYDGPWTDIDEDVEKINGLARHTRPLAGGKLTTTLMLYDNQWNSADQIPQRAVDSGMIDELGSLDTSVGGEAHRYSLSSQWSNNSWSANAYAIQSALKLYSNFTYFLDDSVNGDQFEQVDKRRIFGGSVSRTIASKVGEKTIQQTMGIQLRFDDIGEVGLHRTADRERLSTVRDDEIREYSVGLFWESGVDITTKLSANLGVRFDHLGVDVESDTPVNGGSDNDDLTSVKAGLVYAFDDRWESYLNVGQSFHSNDARGATITVDPATGEPAEQVDLLVRGEGAELGLRFYDSERLNVSTALWLLELDSELLFVGDAGNTEASRPSRRYGLEFAAYYWLGAALSVDLELAWTRSRFTTDEPGEGDRIDGSLPFVGSAGLSWRLSKRWQSNLRLRHFGKRTLDSRNAIRSVDFTVVNLALVFDAAPWKLTASVLNLLDSNDHDIEYFYASRLAGEPAEGVEDRHVHPIEPRTVRLGLGYSF